MHLRIVNPLDYTYVESVNNDGKCVHCGEQIEEGDTVADHLIGGKYNEQCRLLSHLKCTDDFLQKTAEEPWFPPAGIIRGRLK
jgi:hypothetical protein